MTHKTINCFKCGLRLQDSGEHVTEKEIKNRKVRFVGDEEVCSCESKPPRHPFTSRPQPPNLDSYDKH
jgi:hypothetical protein